MAQAVEAITMTITIIIITNVITAIAIITAIITIAAIAIIIIMSNFSEEAGLVCVGGHDSPSPLS